MRRSSRWRCICLSAVVRPGRRGRSLLLATRCDRAERVLRRGRARLAHSVCAHEHVGLAVRGRADHGPPAAPTQRSRHVRASTPPVSLPFSLTVPVRADTQRAAMSPRSTHGASSQAQEVRAPILWPPLAPLLHSRSTASRVHTRRSGGGCALSAVPTAYRFIGCSRGAIQERQAPSYSSLCGLSLRISLST